MIRKAFICLLISLAFSQECQLNVSRLSYMEENLRLNTERLLQKNIGDDNAALFIGTARAGKSTLINYIINNKLKATKGNKFESILIEKEDKHSSGPEIGSGSESKTTVPSKWKSPNLTNLIIWDTPGFGDNRGAEQDITNSYYMKFLIEKVKTLKFIVVVDFIDIISDSTHLFFTLLRHLEGIFEEAFVNIFSSISVIVSKAPETFNDYTVNHDYMKELLENQFLSSPIISLSESSRKFIHYLIDNVNHIGIFRQVKRVGELTSDVDYNIFPAIRNAVILQKTSLPNLKMSLSDKSKLCLGKVSSELQAVMKTSVKDLNAAMSKVCDKMENNLIAAINKSEKKIIQRIQEKLNSSLHIQNVIIDFNYYEYNAVFVLTYLDQIFKTNINETNLLHTIKLITFIDDLMQGEENIMTAKSALTDFILRFQSRTEEIIRETNHLIKEKEGKEAVNNITPLQEIPRNNGWFYWG